MLCLSADTTGQAPTAGPRGKATVGASTTPTLAVDTLRHIGHRPDWFASREYRSTRQRTLWSILIADIGTYGALLLGICYL